MHILANIEWFEVVTYLYILASIEWSEVVTYLPLIGTVILLLLSTQFVTKQEFVLHKSKRDNWCNVLEKRIIELETANKLATQPMSQVLEKLSNIHTTLSTLVEHITSLEKRVMTLEIMNKLRSEEGDSSAGHHRR